MPPALEDRQLGRDERAGNGAIVRIADLRGGQAGFEIAHQHGRDIARAVVEAGPVAAGATIDIAQVAGRLGVRADTSAQLEKAFPGHRIGGQVDDAAAEFAREIDRIALLDQRRGDDIGGEQIERDRPLERFGTGQRRAVEQRQRIAIAKAAHIDEAVADDAEACDAAQRAGDIPFARAGDVRARKHRDDGGRVLLDIGIGAADHHDLAARHGDVGRFLPGRIGGRARRIAGRDLPGGRRAVRIGGRCATGLCKRSGRDQGRGKKQQARKFERRRHRVSPLDIQSSQGGGQPLRPPPAPSVRCGLRSSAARCSSGWRPSWRRTARRSSCRSTPCTSRHSRPSPRRCRSWCRRRPGSRWTGH